MKPTRINANWNPRWEYLSRSVGSFPMTRDLPRGNSAPFRAESERRIGSQFKLAREVRGRLVPWQEEISAAAKRLEPAGGGGRAASSLGGPSIKWMTPKKKDPVPL